MSKARLIITAVVVEGRSQREVARAYGVSQGWVSRLVARYHADRLNRAVAVGEAYGPRAGLAALAELDPTLPHRRRGVPARA